MKSKFANFINSLGWKKILFILVSCIASIAGIVTVVLKVLIFTRDTPPMTNNEIIARQAAKNRESKDHSDQEAKKLDPRFLTFESDIEFLDYAKNNWAPNLNTTIDEKNDHIILAMLASSSRYIIPFKGKLTGEKFGSDDYALLLKGDNNIASNTTSIYDLNSPSAEYDNNPLNSCFDIQENDLTMGSYIVFVNNTSSGLSLTFSNILKDQSNNKIGVGVQKSLTQSNIEDLKEFQKDVNSHYYPGYLYDFNFQLFKLQLPYSWVF